VGATLVSAIDTIRRNKRRRELATKRKRRIPLWPFAVLAIFLLGALGAAGGAAVYSYDKYNSYTKDLTNPADKVSKDQGPAIIYDRDGNQLYEYEDKDTGLREPVPLDAISPYLIKATIATEDPDFYTNRGVNEKGLLRAACEYVHLCHSASAQSTGGSGITQQLVKLLFETPEEAATRSIDRKVKEAAMAVELTKRYNKDQILEWYLNTIFYANRANGIGAAAKIYFNKKASDLDLAEAALLAGIPASPGDYDPIAHYDTAKARQKQVLDLMVEHGQATREEADAAYAEPLDLKEQTTVINEPHWVSFMTDYIKQHCKELIKGCTSGDDALYHMGLRIVTTLDSQLTDQATAIVDKDVADMEKLNCQCHNGAVMVIDNNTGQILAMVGSRNYYDESIGGKNNNTLAEYQPGSALKPIIYLSTFLKGWSPGTIVVDQPKCFPNGTDKPFCPSGPTRSFVGPLPVRVALGSSMNSPAVQAADFSTVPWVLEVAHKMGINTMPDPSKYGVSIATGGSSVTLYDMTYMYSVFANNGEMRGLKLDNPPQGYRKLDPVAVLRITDRSGNLVYQFNGPDRDQVVPAPYAYEITNILSDDSAKHLTYSPGLFNLRDRRPIAAKTGTQQGEQLSQVRATWNFGFIPDITVGVWVGNSDGTFLNPNLLSATSSLNVWKDVMQYAVDKYNIPPKDFVVPPGIARGTPLPPGSRAVGCGIMPDIYVVGQPVAGPPVANGARGCQVIATPGPNGSSVATVGPTGVVPTAAPLRTPAPEVVNTPAINTEAPAPDETQPTPPAQNPPPAAAPPQPPPQQAPPQQAPPVQPQPTQPAPVPPQTQPQQLRCPPGLIVPTAVRNQVCGPGG
jgi:membrane peptidoglycan carboxypeptidase